MSEPLVYLIVLNWNGISDTIACVKSLLQLDYGNKKIVVVDNGSTDNSLDQLQKYADEIDVIKNSKNLGFAGGNNQGIKVALRQQAAYVMLINNDTIVASDMLTYLVQAMETDSTLGMTGPSIYYWDTPNDLWFSGMKFPFKIYFIGRHLLVHNTQQEKVVVEFISGCGMLIRSKALMSVGLLSEDYFMYYEDLDFCLRFQKVGLKLAYIPMAKMWHKVSASTGGKSSPMKQYYQVKSSILFFKQHTKGVKLFISIILRLTHASITVFKELVAGRVTMVMLKKYQKGVQEALLKSGQ